MSGLAAFSVEGPLVAEGDNLVSQWLCIKALWTLKAVFFFLAHPVVVETVAKFPFLHPSSTYPSYCLHSLQALNSLQGSTTTLACCSSQFISISLCTMAA